MDIPLWPTGILQVDPAQASSHSQAVAVHMLAHDEEVPQGPDGDSKDGTLPDLEVPACHEIF